MRAPNRRRTAPADHAPQRGASALAAAAVSLMLIATSCSLSSYTESAADMSPTFTKVSQGDLRYPEAVAAVADLLPADEDTPWLVVGSVLEPTTARTRAAVWSSADGDGWDRLDIFPASRGTSEQMQAVARFQGTLIAVGSAGQGEDADAVVWLSQGDEWQQVDPPEMSGKHEQWAFDVAASDSGIVVIGGERAWGEVRPRVWFSTDGREWQTTDDGWDGPFATADDQSITAVTPVGSGFVAVGWQRKDGQQHGAAWHSPDGVAWELLETPAMAGERRQAVLSVATAGDVVVAGGYQADASGQGQPVVWRSPDGRSWDEAAVALDLHDDKLSTASDLAVRSLSVEGDDLLAAGGARARPHIWRSGDGAADWSLLPNPTISGQFRDGIDLVAVASDGSVTHALGSEPTALQLAGERWVETTDDSFPDGGSKPAATSVIVDGNRTIVGGYLLDYQRGGEPQRYRGHVWVRRGGGRFSVIEPEGIPQDFESGSVDAMSTYQDGYVGVGIEDFSVARERLLGGDNSPNAMVWTSEDGQAWTRQAAAPSGVDINEAAEILALLESGDPEALAESAISLAAEEPWLSAHPAGGPGTRALRSVAALGDGFIAAGSAFRDGEIVPIVAVSEDGTSIHAEDAGLRGEGTRRFHDVCVADDQAIAVGVVGQDNNAAAAVQFRDRDGEWHDAIATDDSFAGGGARQALACAASDEGFIVVGSDGSSDDLNAKVWLSEDGLEWEELAADVLGGNGDQQATAVTAVPQGGWLIAGTDTGPSSDGGVALWRLRPGGELIRRDVGEPRLNGPGPKTVADVAVTRDRTVIVGADVDGVGIWESRTDALDR